MAEEQLDFFIENGIRSSLVNKGAIIDIHDASSHIKSKSNKQLLNAVEIIDQNSSSGGATTLLNTSIASSAMATKNTNINNNLQSSPPKQYDFIDNEKARRKRKLVGDTDEEMIVDYNGHVSTSVIYSSNKKRHLQNHINPQNFMLSSDFFFSDNQATQFINQTNINIYTDIENTAYDIFQLTEYQDEIFENLFDLENNYTPLINPCFLDKHKSSYFIKPSMRAILIDWLLQVHSSFKLTSETLFLAINLMDRYISLNKVTLKKLQLLAITCLFTAAKVEEVKLPKLSKYCYMTDNAYTNAQMVEAEMAVLKCLDFKVSLPGPMTFASRFLKVTKNELCEDKIDGLAAESSHIEALNNQRQRNVKNEDHAHSTAAQNSFIDNCDMLDLISQYLIEAAITSPMFIQYKHSYLAAMSVYIIRMMYDNQYPNLNTFIPCQPPASSNSADFKFDFFREKVTDLWPSCMPLLTNGIEADSTLQNDVELLLREIAVPSTKLPTLDTKWSTTVGASVKAWCKETYEMVNDQRRGESTEF